MHVLVHVRVHGGARVGGHTHARVQYAAADMTTSDIRVQTADKQASTQVHVLVYLSHGLLPLQRVFERRQASHERRYMDSYESTCGGGGPVIAEADVDGPIEKLFDGTRTQA